MSTKFPSLIRTEPIFTTPTFIGVDRHDVVVSNENFRQSKQPSEYIVFFRHQDALYYPLALEFRYIENNILFLIEEYHVGSFGLLRRILLSSYEKEEGFDVNIQALVYHPRNKPRWCQALPKFIIEPEFRTDMHE